MEKEEKELLFKNTTTLNENDITNLQLFAIKKHTIIIATIITLLLCGLGIGLCFVNAYIGAAIIIAGIVGGVIFFPYISREQIKRQNAMIFTENKYVNVFDFYEDILKVTNIDDKSEENIFQTFEYGGIYKVIDYKEFVVLYVNKKQSFILLKTCMNKGTIDGLLNFLKNKKIKIIDKKSLGEVKKIKIKK